MLIGAVIRAAICARIITSAMLTVRVASKVDFALKSATTFVACERLEAGVLATMRD
jgi:hypothetical protein